MAKVQVTMWTVPPPATTRLSSSRDYSSSVPFRKIISKHYAKCLDLLGYFLNGWACPKSRPVPRMGLSQEWACPKSGPIPRMGLSQKWACPESGLVPMACPKSRPVPRVGLSQGHVPRVSLSQEWACPKSAKSGPTECVRDCPLAQILNRHE